MHVTLDDGSALHFEQRGNGPLLVLLNGMSQTTANWRSQVRPLSEHFSVISYDARGQGKTPLGDRPLTLEQHVSDLHQLLDVALDHANQQTVILCGFSHGARVALGYAAAHPARVGRLALTSIGTNDDVMRDTITRGWVAILDAGGLPAMAWATLPQILGRSFLTANHKHLDAMVKATEQRNTPEGLRALVVSLRAFPPPIDDARAVQVPTMLMTSNDDLLVAPESAAALAAAFTKCDHRVVSDSGHTIPIEQPDVWRATLLSFLRP
ncbi:MAG: 3-oxoadipate enol-lactonase [Bradymonadia bacterium]|jgi:3-oxoadipate enol-lactonase